MKKQTKKLPYALIILFDDKFGMGEDDFYFIHVDDPKYFKEKRLDYKTIFRLPKKLFYERYQDRIIYMSPKTIDFKKANRTMDYVIKTINYNKAIVYDITNPEQPLVVLDPKNPEDEEELGEILTTFLHEDFSPNYAKDLRKYNSKRNARYRRAMGE